MMTILTQLSNHSLWGTISELDEDHTYEEYHAAVEDEQNKSIARLKVEILRTRLAREFDRSQHIKLCQSKAKKIKSIRKRLNQHQLEYKSEVSVHRYVPHVKTVTTPSYIYVLQAKVLRDLHQFCILHHQEQLAEEQAADCVRAMKRAMNQQGEERLCAERDILTEMMAINQDTEQLREMYKERLSVQQGLKDALRQKYATDFEQSPGIDCLLSKISALPEESSPAAPLEKRKSEDSNDRLVKEDLSGGSDGTMDTSIGTDDGSFTPSENVLIIVDRHLPWSGSDLSSQRSVICA